MTAQNKGIERVVYPVVVVEVNGIKCRALLDTGIKDQIDEGIVE